MLLIIIVSFKNPAFRPHSFSLTYLPILLYYGIQQVFCHSTYRTYILPESTNQARSANFFLMMSMILPFPFMNLFFGFRFPGFFLWGGRRGFHQIRSPIFGIFLFWMVRTIHTSSSIASFHHSLSSHPPTTQLPF